MLARLLEGLHGQYYTTLPTIDEKHCILTLSSHSRLREVPWGELVGQESFATLSKVYTGYGEKGPGQGLLHRQGALEQVERDFPSIDYITSCIIQDEEWYPLGGTPT